MHLVRGKSLGGILEKNSKYTQPVAPLFFSRVILLLTGAILVGVSTTGSAAPSPSFPSFKPAKLAEIHATVTNAMARKELPGAIVWIERQGLTWQRTFGQRALVPAPEPMTADTIFDVASLTKVVATAPSVLRLIEQGRLHLDEKVRAYVPEFKADGSELITVRHLLTHTSGLRAGLPGNPAWTGYEKGIELACRESPTHVPGTFFRYSDINFILLGEIVQRVSGRRLHEFAAAEIFRPLRLHDTSYLPAETLLNRIAPTEQSAEGMLRGRVHDPTARRMGGVAGHAGLFSTSTDLARFARMLLNQGQLDGVRIFKPESVRMMTSVQSPEVVLARRGLGWDIDSPFSRPRGTVFPRGSFGHTGWTGTALWIDPFSKTFWMLLSNRVHPDGKGNTVPLYLSLGILAGEAVDGFDFRNVEGALPFRTNFIQAAAPPARGPTNLLARAQSRPALPGVLNGIDVLVKQNFAPLKKLRLGLVTNHTGQDRWRNPTIDLLFQAPDVQLKALFSPEHGIRGAIDEHVFNTTDEQTGLPVYSLYPRIPRREPNQSDADFEAMSLHLRSPTAAHLQDLDALIFDIQDIGCRFYTYTATMGNCLRAAAAAGKKIFVLDRVNPIGGLAVEGPLHTGHPAFVAWHSLPLRHGLTIGELARLFNAERQFKADLTVIPCEGWKRDQWFDQTGQPWIHPSPNMRSLEAAALYPGVGLHEAALSVGRGTDRPFELIGAPYIDDLILAETLNRAGLAGVRFYPIQFTPTYSTFLGQPCRGVAIVLTDRQALNAVAVGLEIALTLQRLYPGDYALDKIQHLLRHTPTIDAIRAGRSRAEILASWDADRAAFEQRRKPHLLY
jgi:uncharacterized protein YbbC (DUF1343 family)/CubicO group peptidase (beta-lactamase class C family)